MSSETVDLPDQLGLDRQHYLAGDVAQFDSRRIWVACVSFMGIQTDPLPLRPKP